MPLIVFVLDFAVMRENDTPTQLALCQRCFLVIPLETIFRRIVLAMQERFNPPAPRLASPHNLIARRRQHEMNYVAVDISLSEVIRDGVSVVQIRGWARWYQSGTLVRFGRQLDVAMVGSDRLPIAHPLEQVDVRIERYGFPGSPVGNLPPDVGRTAR
jgi:hypothetical protein